MPAPGSHMRSLTLLAALLLCASCQPDIVEVERRGTYLIAVVRGIAAADRQGSDWDDDQSGPDAIVCLTLPDGEFCTQPQADTLLPEWDESTVLGEYNYKDRVELNMRLIDQDDSVGTGDVVCEMDFSDQVSRISGAYCCEMGMFYLLAATYLGNIEAPEDSQSV